jgi:hypothetical protein
MYEGMVEDINMLLNTGDIPNLYGMDEKVEILDKMQTAVRESVTKPTLFSSLFIIISLLMSPLLGHRPAIWITHKENPHSPPRERSADWWVLMTANAAGNNGLTCFPKHGGARDNKFLVTHPMTDQHCLISVIAHQAH